MRAFYERMLARQAELRRDLDEKTAQSMLREAKAWLGSTDGVDDTQHSRRVLVAARRLARVSRERLLLSLLEKLLFWRIFDFFTKQFSTTSGEPMSAGRTSEEHDDRPNIQHDFDR